MQNGLLNLSVWELVVAGLVMTHITIASVTIFLHRHQAHRALDLHPVVSHFFRFWLWLTTGMNTREWVAIHRKHHAKCETPDDPHSPQVYGIRKVMLEGAELYRREASDAETLEQFGVGTPADWVERRIYSRFQYLGLVLMLAADLALFGVLGLTIWAVQMIWIPFWAAGVINGLGHYSGYRNFETRDAATNISPLGILIGGEELHNNHHAYPASAKLSYHWWEFDIGWFYIRSLELVRLARVKRCAPKFRIEWNKAVPDYETVMAILQNRVHIITLYSREVILPVLRGEARTASAETRRLFKKARPLMIREYLARGDHLGSDLKSALEASQALATVYRFKQQLKDVWGQASLSQETRLEALRLWCEEAEKSGILCLQNFALMVRGYSLVPTAA
ncbi:fatty acid desaturase [Methylococcus sp. EFPC2]|uniref:DesA family fatty acid desaturase n=1 Tax=Methylococcus sp. EFPC2 TaxID=2812648 RepID=UPI001967E991|nr:fatty acid desaturase [Methylococcus sp. EFPC2]QSA97941.1 fatty acid desaturase [Methylococcus sp. EFPC2]